jgi:hypothetical protein
MDMKIEEYLTSGKIYAGEYSTKLTIDIFGCTL